MGLKLSCALAPLSPRPPLSTLPLLSPQFADLPVQVELVPALGAEPLLALAFQAAAFGGADLVLLHPEYLKEQGPGGVLARLKAGGFRVAAFGWAQVGRG